jgi:hypothetical protein
MLSIILVSHSVHDLNISDHEIGVQHGQEISQKKQAEEETKFTWKKHFTNAHASSSCFGASFGPCLGVGP